MPEGPEIERLRDELLILENRRLQEVNFYFHGFKIRTL